MIKTLTSARFLISLILIGAFLVRLHHITAPIADWHSWRQADTSSVSRNFARDGFDILHPRFDDISNVASKLDNPNGYRFVEFPLYNVLQTGFFLVFGTFSLEVWGRLVSILASVLSTFLLFLLMKKYAGVEAGLYTAFFYAFLPFSIYYGRTILPDTTMVAATLGGIYFFDLWIEKRIKNQESRIMEWSLFILAILFTAVALLLKPYAVFFLLPMGYISWKRFGMSMFIRWQLIVFAVISILPLVLWRQWMTQFPEGIPTNQWLFNGNGIRFRPAFFRWIVYERVVKLISGYAGIGFLLAGGVQAVMIKNSGFFLSFLISTVLYVTVFATGNVQHDYYQILIIPTVAVFFGLGALFISRFFRERNTAVGVGIIALLTALTFYFSWDIVKDYFNINNPVIIEAGRVVDEKTPKDARIIALYNGDTSFLYQTKRKGWSSFQNPLPVMVAKGADYLVQIDPNPGDIALYETEYEIAASSSAYVLVKLR
jgi:hypothetical protein